jgi:hypothetical protein
MTGREIEPAIDTDPGSLRLVHPVKIRLRCPFCDQPHEWQVAQPPAEARRVA